MSARCVLEPFSDPSINVDLLLFATLGHPRVSSIDFEERRQMTVEDERVETSLPDVDHSSTRRLMEITRSVIGRSVYHL
jgi:hypothetical protein